MKNSTYHLSSTDNNQLIEAQKNDSPIKPAYDCVKFKENLNKSELKTLCKINK